MERTPLHDLHLQLGATMVDFAGYEMPLHYPLGIKREHLHCRQQAALFDVSHMGVFKLSGQNKAQALERLTPANLTKLAQGRQKYALLTNEKGGVIDDLMISHLEDALWLVVNAACKEKDFNHLQQHLPDSVVLEAQQDFALLALQGPKAVEVLAKLNSQVATMSFMDVGQFDLLSVPCMISRSGYTGEDGFEILMPAQSAKDIALAITENPTVQWAGLGARNSLRLEAGLCLYGNELDEHHSPIEAKLRWTVRSQDQIQSNDFLGAENILKQMQLGTAKTRVGLVGENRVPVRDGSLLFLNSDDTTNNTEIGVVTSGTFSPSLEKPIAMAWLNAEFGKLDQQVFALVRGKLQPMRVTKLPFVAHRYQR